MTRRHGFTLSELVVAMSAGSALMIVAVGLLHQSLSLSSVARQRNDYLRTSRQLARQFRTDVHLATEATVSQQGSLELKNSDQSVVSFQADSNRVIRVQSQKDGPARRWEYILLSNATATFSLRDDPNRAVATITRSPIVGQEEIVDRTIEAVIGHRGILETGEVTR